MNLSKQDWFFVSKKQLNGLVALQHTSSRECLANAVKKQGVEFFEQEKSENLIPDYWLKDFAKYRKQGFQCHHFHILFGDLPITERDKQCLLTWNEIYNILREMRDEPVETKQVKK